MTTKTKRKLYHTQLEGGLTENFLNKGNTGTAITLDCRESSSQYVTLNNNATVTLAGFINGKTSTITVMVARNATTTNTLAFAVSGGGTIWWAEGGGLIQPTAVANSFCIYTFVSVNGGTTVQGNIAGLGYT